MRFSDFYNINEVAPPPPPGGMPPMGGPPPGGLPPGGLGGPTMPMGKPMGPMGGGMPPMGLGGPPMGGPGAGQQQPPAQPTEIKTKDVWSLLEKLLSGDKVADKKHINNNS